MPFTGRIGTDLSYLSNIVLGIVDSFDLSSIGYKAHVIGVREIRIVFDRSMSDVALNASAYQISAVSPFITFIPTIESVRFEDANEFSVILTTSDRLLFNAVYSIQILGVLDKFGRGVSGDAKNFTNNVQDPPIAIAAFLSTRGAMDVVFDRPVGPYSLSATAIIRDADTPASDQPMSLVPWASSGIDEDTMRFVYPVTTPTASNFEIAFTGINDISGNSASSIIPVSLGLISDGPFNSSSLAQLQLTEGFAHSVSPQIGVTKLRVYFNGPVLRSDALNFLLWEIEEEGPHGDEDPSEIVVSADSFDLASCITLVNEIKSKFNVHVKNNIVHIFSDISSVISTPDASDLPTLVSLLTDLCSKYASHINKEQPVHTFKDLNTNFSSNPEVTNLSSSIQISNYLKSIFNSHIITFRPVPFFNDTPSEIGIISSHADSSFSYPIRDEFSWFVDLHVSSKNPFSRHRVRVQVQSEDTGSSTNPANTTGDISCLPYFRDSYIKTFQSIPDNILRVRTDSSSNLLNGFSLLSSDIPAFLKKLPLEISVRSCFDTFNWLVFAYSWHIGPEGAVHPVNETVSLVTFGDYAFLIDENDLITKTNSFAAKFAKHISNSVSHFSVPRKFEYLDSTDLLSCYKLIQRMSIFLIDHNSSGDFVNNNYYPMIYPKNLGVHSSPGPIFCPTDDLDTFYYSAEKSKHDDSSQLNACISKYIFDPITCQIENFKNEVVLDFQAKAYRPSLAAAVPQGALVIYEDGTETGGVRLEKDLVEVWFSKPMQDQSIDETKLILSGGSIMVEDISWTTERTASIRVSSMDTISYTLNAVDLYDRSGNLIY